MNIEEAKDILVNIIADEVIGTYCIEIQKTVDCSKNCENDDCIYIKAIETVLNELDKKDKVIDMMADKLTTEYHNKEWIKKYFYKQLESN